MQVDNVAEKLKKNEKVIALILYGSQVSGSATPLSDWDLCAITKQLSEEEQAEITSFSSGKISVVTFNQLPLAIQYKVFASGRELFSKDEEFVEELQEKTIKKWVDFKPILNSYYRNAIGFEI